jgi:hypothetical protein
MKALNIILMLVLFVLAFRRLKQDYTGGLALVTAFVVSLPDYLRISFGGGIPELTVQRLLLLGLLFTYRSAPHPAGTPPPVPLLRGLLWFSGAQFVSMVLSIALKGSLKWWMVFNLEILAYYFIVSRVMVSREAIVRLLRGIAYALAGVALLAAIEKYRGINLSRHLLLGWGIGDFDITSTYPHRILMGYAMAMAVPILFALREREQSKGRKRLMGLMVLMAVAGCYFSNSRGPWSGLILGGGILFILGSNAMRRSFAMLGVLAVLLMAVKPGVRETVFAAVKSIFEEDSVKANSYNYRWKLWEIAYAEIRKSPERTLFGYGGLSNMSMDLGEYFEKGAGGSSEMLGYTSWDNQMACDLIELGVVGFGIEMGLFAAILWMLGKAVWRAKGSDRSIMAGFLAACVIFMFGMSNVYIFSPQLRCLFWTLVACGVRFGQLKDIAPEAETKAVPERDEFLDQPPWRRRSQNASRSEHSS